MLMSTYFLGSETCFTRDAWGYAPSWIGTSTCVPMRRRSCPRLQLLGGANLLLLPRQRWTLLAVSALFSFEDAIPFNCFHFHFRRDFGRPVIGRFGERRFRCRRGWNWRCQRGNYRGNSVLFDFRLSSFGARIEFSRVFLRFRGSVAQGSVPEVSFFLHTMIITFFMSCAPARREKGDYIKHVNFDSGGTNDHWRGI